MQNLNIKKKGFELGSVWKIALGFIGVVVLMKVLATLLPDVISAGDELCTSGGGLFSLFSSDHGVFGLILTVAVLGAVIGGIVYVTKFKK